MTSESVLDMAGMKRQLLNTNSKSNGASLDMICEEKKVLENKFAS